MSDKVTCAGSYPEAAVTISRQVALIFSEDSSQAAQSQDGVSLNNRTVPEAHTAHIVHLLPLGLRRHEPTFPIELLTP